MQTKDFLTKYGIIPDPIKDQFFLEDEDIAKRTAELAELTNKDIVLEIGAGTGILTEELAKKAKKVIAFEIDPRFKIVLNQLPKNVEMYYENAWEYVQLHGKFWKKKEYNKVVANMPYSFVEQFLHNLTFLYFDKVILLVPIKFVRKIESNPIFGSFFKYTIEFEVGKEKFYPVPRTNSAVINLTHLPDALETKNLGLFLRQFMYQHEDQKVKNSLMEGLIVFYKKVLTKSLIKNEAREIVNSKNLNTEWLEETPGTKELYEAVSESFKDY